MKIKKIIVFLIILITLISITLVSNADSLLKDFKGEVGTDAADRVSGVLGTALNIIQIIGVAVAVIILMVLGIKYMVASASDRAEIKKHAIVYVTGAIIMFGAAGFIEIIKSFALGIGK